MLLNQIHAQNIPTIINNLPGVALGAGSEGLAGFGYPPYVAAVFSKKGLESIIAAGEYIKAQNQPMTQENLTAALINIAGFPPNLAQAIAPAGVIFLTNVQNSITQFFNTARVDPFVGAVNLVRNVGFSLIGFAYYAGIAFGIPAGLIVQNIAYQLGGNNLVNLVSLSARILQFPPDVMGYLIGNTYLSLAQLLDNLFPTNPKLAPITYYPNLPPPVPPYPTYA